MALEIAARLAPLPVQQALGSLSAAGVPATRAPTRAQTLDDPWLESNRFFHVVDDPVFGPCQVVRSYVEWSCSGLSPANAPGVGPDARSTYRRTLAEAALTEVQALLARAASYMASPSAISGGSGGLKNMQFLQIASATPSPTSAQPIDWPAPGWQSTRRSGGPGEMIRSGSTLRWNPPIPMTRAEVSSIPGTSGRGSRNDRTRAAGEEADAIEFALVGQQGEDAGDRSSIGYAARRRNRRPLELSAVVVRRIEQGSGGMAS